MLESLSVVVLSCLGIRVLESRSVGVLRYHGIRESRSVERVHYRCSIEVMLLCF